MYFVYFGVRAPCDFWPRTRHIAIDADLPQSQWRHTFCLLFASMLCHDFYFKLILLLRVECFAHLISYFISWTWWLFVNWMVMLLLKRLRCWPFTCTASEILFRIFLVNMKRFSFRFRYFPDLQGWIFRQEALFYSYQATINTIQKTTLSYFYSYKSCTNFLGHSIIPSYWWTQICKTELSEWKVQHLSSSPMRSWSGRHQTVTTI